MLFTWKDEQQNNYKLVVQDKIVTKNTFSSLKQVKKWGFSIIVSTNEWI
jgi:hypothetical protein